MRIVKTFKVCQSPMEPPWKTYCCCLSVLLGLSKSLAVTFRIRIFVVFVSWQSEGIFKKLFCQIRLVPAKLENGNILMSQIKNLRCHGRF